MSHDPGASSSDSRRDRPIEEAAPPYRRISLPQITAGDFDIAIIGQLATAELALNDKLEPGSMEVVALDALLGRWALDQ
jgi:hypothetical protein